MTEHNFLTDAEYALWVAQPLAVAADVAARRGNPQLAGDLPSMLALRTVLETLAGCYWQERLHHPAHSGELVVHAAPAAVCAMVLQEAGLPRPAAQSCLLALRQAYAELVEAGVVGPELRFTLPAWTHLKAGDADAARGLLQSAMLQVIQSVIVWESTRSEAAGGDDPPPAGPGRA